MKTRIILVRHAEAEGNYKRLFHGWSDGGITKKGHMQAVLAAEKLKEYKIDRIFSSPLLRTMQTAGYIAKIKNIQIKKDDRLKEINGGDWEGQRWDELSYKWPKEYDTWENKPHIHQMPNGESMNEFYSRIKSVIDDLVTNNKGENICVFTHGTVIKALMCYFYGYSLEKMIIVRWFDNTAISIVDFSDNGIKVIVEGNDDHLEDENKTVINQEWWNEYIEKHKKITSETE
ncbi:MAG: histidine phosphatase family protein [Clostridiales bacterium]